MTEVGMRTMVRNLWSGKGLAGKPPGARHANVFAVLIMLIASLVAIPAHAQLSAACQAITNDWSGGRTINAGDPLFYLMYSGFSPNEEIYYSVQSTGTDATELNAAAPGAPNSTVFGIEADYYTPLQQLRPNSGSEVNASGSFPVDPTQAYYPYFEGSLNPGATGSLTAHVGCRSTLSTPTLTGLSPTSGTTTGGVSVTITGTGFTGVTAVSFGGSAATSFTVNSNTSITATAPAHAAGTVDVTVTSPGGTSATSSASHFTYVAPLTLSPASSALPAGTAASAYSQTFTASGGTSPYTYSVTVGAIPAGLALNGSSGVLSGTPTVSGTFNFSIRVTDNVGTIVTNSYSLTINPEPTPTTNDVSATVAANSSNNTITLSISGPATSVSVVTAPSHGTANASGTSITYTPTPGYSGSDNFTYRATNSTGGSSSPSNVTITVSPPTIVLSPGAGALPAATEGSAYSQTFSATNGTGPYTFILATGALPAGLTLSSAGVLSGTPTATGNFSFSVQATDIYGATGAMAYTLNVAVATPVAGPASATVAANSLNNPITLALSGGAASSVAVASGPSHGSATVSGTSITYTPTAGYSGSDSFTYTATNASGTSAPATVTITVSAPTLTLSPASGALPGGTVGASYSQPVSATAGTAPYTYAVTAGQLPAGLTLNAATGTISGTPTTVESQSFTIQATDTYGATGAANYTLAIVAAPLAAPVAGNVAVTVGANTSSNAVPLALSGGTADFVSIGGPLHGTATASGTTITYTPNPGYSGTDSFIYTATNATGTSAPATITVTVTAPTLTLTPSAGTLTHGTVGAAYTQSFVATGGTAPYTYAITSGHAPAGLTLNAASGVLSGTPTTVESQTFAVTATDTYGATGTATYTLAIAAAPVAPPVASNVSQTVTANSSANTVTLALSGGPAASVAVASAPSHGTATASGTSISYTPTAGYSGPDSFTYTATNASGTSAPATVSISVSAPTLVVTPAAGALPSGTVGSAYSQSLSTTGGLAPYHYVATGLPAGLTINATTGAITGTPTTAGNSNISVTVTDAGIATKTVAYTLAITAANPTAPTLTGSTVSGRMASFDLTSGATGGPFTAATIVSVTPAGSATAAIVEVDSTIGHVFHLNVTPNRGFNGTIVVAYQLTNAANQSVSSTATLTVEGRPDPSADPRVRAMSDAQTEATRRFSHAQVENFMRRAETLHDAECGRSQMAIRLTSSDAVRRDGLPGNAGDTTMRRVPSVTHGAYVGDSTAFARRGGATKRCNESVGVWVGGVLDIGSRNATGDRSKLSAATTGLSAGFDKAVANRVNLGLGVGVGTDGTNVAGGDAHSSAKAQTIAAYGSASPVKGVFIDAMASHGWIDFGTRRLVTSNSMMALGHREGHFNTATVSTGADRQMGSLRWSLYGRGEYLDGTLDSYGETGADVYDLRFDARDVRSMLGVFGFRMAHRQTLRVAIVSPSIRGEWQHEFTDGTNQTLDYADLEGPSFYSIAAQGWSREQFTLTPSVDVVVPAGWKFNVELGFRAADGERAATSRVQIGKVF